MSRLVLALTLSALPVTAFAQPAITCATFAEERNIPAPPDSLTDQDALLALTKTFLPINFDIDLISQLPGAEAVPLPQIRETGGCSLREMAMLTANFAAIDTAEPPADPAALAGTWMSDDIFLSAASVVMSGQEVLVIGDPVSAPDAPSKPGMGPVAGSLPVSQYWYHDFSPHNWSVWNEKNEYYGLITSGYLAPKDKGAYADDPVQPLLDYSGITILPERTEDLFLKSRLNVFQRDVVFALAQDTLVLTYDAPVPIQRVWAERKRTYHRVAPGSPDAALRMVQAAGLSTKLHFDCLAQKISDEDPALLAAIAPMTLAEFDAMQREYDLWKLDQHLYFQVIEGGGEDEALKQKFIGQVKRMSEIREKMQEMGQAIKEANLCSELPYFGGY